MLSPSNIPPTIGLRRRRDDWDICFNPMSSVRDLWLIIGALIVLWGIQQLLNINLYKVWAVILVVVGLYIIYRSLKRPGFRL